MFCKANSNMEICHSFAALKTNKYTHVENCSSSVNKFILLGFPYTWDIRILCFSVFSGTYILTLIGNLCIICAVRCDHQLQTPMYILLANFSFLEIWFVTSTVPNMLANFLSKKRKGKKSLTQNPEVMECGRQEIKLEGQPKCSASE